MDPQQASLRQAVRRARAALLLGPGSWLVLLALRCVGEFVDLRPFFECGHLLCCGSFLLVFGHACSFFELVRVLPATQLRPVPRDVRLLFGYWTIGPAAVGVLAGINACCR